MTQCSKCVLDQHDDPSIFFDEQGVCNHCRSYEKTYIENWPSKEALAQIHLQKIEEIKASKGNRKYDCILGLSGGVDSSYLAYLAKQWGLNPLLVHFDNGWNSELAVQNIQGIVEATGFDLYTYVVDWEEFKDLQLSYIKSGVLDWEIPTDHGFLAMLYQQAFKRNINYILSGHNYATEAILPKCMRWSKLDVANILDIHKQYGSVPLKTFPLLPFYKAIYFAKIRKFNVYSPLNYIDYQKDKAKEIIKKEFGWKDYAGKHYESIFTRFYQGYVLVKKFGFDKRKAHYATLINSKQISKEQALEELKKPAYDPIQYQEDLNFVLKKLDLSATDFENIMQSPPVSHLAFKSYETGLYRKHEKFMRFIKPLTKLLKRL